MMGIYKITNKINGKAYIGMSVDIEGRWKGHIKYAFDEKNENSPYYHNRLYTAFRKYGLENFEFEVLEECEKHQLKEREKYWIEYYDTYNNGYNLTTGGDIGGYDLTGENHPNAKLTEKDVRNIRTMYANLERKMFVYELYKDRISLSGFNKIWQGKTWKHVMMDVYTPDNKEYHAKNTGMVGSKNGRAIITEQDIKNIRIRKKNGESISQVYKTYSHLFSFHYFKHIWYGGTWKHVVVE